ncbi:MAG TPA: 4-hydroxy-tetrahydrodipicolinate reductase [Candidatus Angelobacter sp.]|jgi:4-hydroxy-tetrahydrodipicolinate reductase|nr:4-hydroxy-tetrahydrodipicolinate reductase [Candidatus Angelobacter sp.]
MANALHLALLGSGKTGSLVAEIAAERGHKTTVLTEIENPDGTWLTPENLSGVDAVIDFTTPEAVLGNVAKCIAARKPMVVGTTGWYGEMERIRKEVELAGCGFVFGANFSYGVNLFFQIARAAAPALHHGYSGHITERHHIHKKDAPSGTAVALQRVVEQACDVRVEISSEREGDVMGEHTLELTSGGDRMVLSHEVKSRRTFALGAVLAAEWIVGRTGFYDFKDIFSQL